MAKIENEGTFAVRITDALVKEPGYGYHNSDENKTNDPKAFALVLKVETPDGAHAFHQMEWTKKPIAKGKYAGMTDAECTTAKLAELGIPDGYPGNLKKMLMNGETIPCSVKMEWRSYTDSKTQEIKRTLECRYINPPRAEKNIKDIDFDALLGGKTTVPTVAPKKAEEPALDDSFNPDEFAVEGEASPM